MPLDIKSAKQRFRIWGNGLDLEIERAIKAATTDLPVLIQGESGTGKEVFPKIIHQYSARKQRNYIAINCGSIPEGTIDSELFGHEKGSFTGAVGERKGYFEEANGGTIFLDELGEMPMPTQARLLRVLETGEFMRVGSSKVLRTDVRVVAATNADLEQAIKQGRFREDLYYRINTIPIKLRPLRERRDDILVLLNHFMNEFADKYNITNMVEFTTDARHHLYNAEWQGNIRQLKNFAEQVSLFEEGKLLSATDLERYVPKANTHLQLFDSSEQTTNPQLLQFMMSNIQQLMSRIQTLEERIQHLTDFNSGTTDSQPIVSAHVIPQIIEASRQEQATEHEYAEVVEITPIAIENKETLKESSVRQIKESLERNNGNRRQTARELGISERQLYRIIDKNGWDKKNLFTKSTSETATSTQDETPKSRKKNRL